MLRCDITRGTNKSDYTTCARHVDNPASCGIAPTVGWQRSLVEKLRDGVLATKEDTANIDTHGNIKCSCHRLVKADATGFCSESFNVDCYARIIDHAAALSLESCFLISFEEIQGPPHVQTPKLLDRTAHKCFNLHLFANIGPYKACLSTFLDDHFMG